MNNIQKFANISLVFIFLVIIAGSVVRMTGSGMGCPDWPKCFGYYIPPTSEEVLIWQPNKSYKPGQIIISNETLLVAKSNFTSANSFDLNNWDKYTKHDYATFNVAHTWTEYINRLIGALSGIPVLLLVYFSLKAKRNRKFFILLSLSTLFMLGFEAWLGKKVVDGNLIPGHITMHMVGAVLIVLLLLAISAKSNANKMHLDLKFKYLLIACISLTVLQIILGSQVREEVDLLLANNTSRSQIVGSFTDIFKWHRSLAILVLLANGWFIYKVKHVIQSNHIKLIAVTLFIEILLGIGLSYLDLTPWMQPTHLLAALLLFAFQTHLFFRSTLK